MTAEIVRFPAPRQRRVRERLGLDRSPPAQRLGEIDEELRTLERAIAALNRRRVAVLAAYRAEVERLRRLDAC